MNSCYPKWVPKETVVRWTELSATYKKQNFQVAKDWLKVGERLLVSRAMKNAWLKIGKCKHVTLKSDFIALCEIFYFNAYNSEIYSNKKSRKSKTAKSMRELRGSSLYKMTKAINGFFSDDWNRSNFFFDNNEFLVFQKTIRRLEDEAKSAMTLKPRTLFYPSTHVKREFKSLGGKTTHIVRELSGLMRNGFGEPLDETVAEIVSEIFLKKIKKNYVLNVVKDIPYTKSSLLF